MYGDQFGEFVCRYWGLKGWRKINSNQCKRRRVHLNNHALPNLWFWRNFKVLALIFWKCIWSGLHWKILAASVRIEISCLWPQKTLAGNLMIIYITAYVLVQGLKLTLANSQNASDFDNLRVRKIFTCKRLRVRIIHVSQTKENNLLVVSPVC